MLLMMMTAVREVDVVTVVLQVIGSREIVTQVVTILSPER
jgi:hypothetical protein